MNVTLNLVRMNNMLLKLKLNNKPNQNLAVEKATPMSSAPLKYFPDGRVDWGNMWDSFCALPRDGGPPHRAAMLYADETADTAGESYQLATGEIIRGIAAVSGLTAEPAGPGWIAVHCHSAAMARWLSEAITQENVQARCHGSTLFVPTGAGFSLKGEIKNVITAVAKTSHYWQEHLPVEVKRTLALREWLLGVKARFFPEFS